MSTGRWGESKRPIYQACGSNGAELGEYGFWFYGIRTKKRGKSGHVVCVGFGDKHPSDKVFSVPHSRYSKKYGNTPLKDPREIYNQIASQAARRVRACILGIIPGDIIEEAVEQCHSTLINGEEKPLEDLIKDCVRTAEKTYQVPQESLEKYIGCKASAFSMNDLIRLKRAFNSIKDGMAKREEIFELPGVEKKEAEDAFSGKKKEEKPADSQQQLDLGGGADEAK